MLPLIKEPRRVPKHPRREIVDAILYLVRTGCSWRQLPVDFPPWQTVYWQFKQWKKRQVTQRILDLSRPRSRRTGAACGWRSVLASPVAGSAGSVSGNE